MYELLSGIRLVEGASFVAAPSCALHLQQMGAEVIRFDTIGGGPDFRRWPKAPNGSSYYWEGLNKGKKSVAINLSSTEGRELAVALAAAVGLFVTNYPAEGFLSHQALLARRADMITVRVMGWADGANALDYTVNSAIGLPYITGPAELGDAPVNHVLPAWDLTTGLYAAFALLAAERQRAATGRGIEVRVPLGDIAIATLGNIGQLAEVGVSGKDRERLGNDLFGAYGRDFETRDKRRVMVTAISGRQWSGLLKALDIGAPVSALEAKEGISFARDEGARFKHRHALNAIVGAAIASRDYADLAAAFQADGVTWGPFRTLSQALRDDPRLSEANPILSRVEHVSGATYLTPGAPATIPQRERLPAVRAPYLGEHTEEVLADLLGLSGSAIGRLVDREIVAVADRRAQDATNRLARADH